jgi:hypothetical protein
LIVATYFCAGDQASSASLSALPTLKLRGRVVYETLRASLVECRGRALRLRRDCLSHLARHCGPALSGVRPRAGASVLSRAGELPLLPAVGRRAIDTSPSRTKVGDTARVCGSAPNAKRRGRLTVLSLSRSIWVIARGLPPQRSLKPRAGAEQHAGGTPGLPSMRGGYPSDRRPSGFFRTLRGRGCFRTCRGSWPIAGRGGPDAAAHLLGPGVGAAAVAEYARAPDPSWRTTTPSVAPGWWAVPTFREGPGGCAGAPTARRCKAPYARQCHRGRASGLAVSPLPAARPLSTRPRCLGPLYL